MQTELHNKKRENSEAEKKIIELTNSTEKFNTGRRKDYWQTIYYVSDIR